MQLGGNDFPNFFFRKLPMLTQAEGDILTDRHGIEEGRILENHPHVSPHTVHPLFVIVRNIFAVDKNSAACRLLQADNKAQSRTLPGTAGTENN